MKITLEDLMKRPLSYSSLKEFGKSPAHFVHYRNKPKEGKSDDLIFGSLVDTLKCQPVEFGSKYAVLPLECTQGLGMKERKLKFLDENKGKEIISPILFERAQQTVISINRNEIAKPYFARAKERQKKLVWTDEETGLPFIGYVDNDGDDFFLELKTAESASQEKFIRSAISYDYPLQGAMYVNGYKSIGQKKKPVYIVAESSAPYAVAVYDRVSKDYLAYGQKMFDKLKFEFLACLENQSFEKSYDFRNVMGKGFILDLPNYLKNDL